MAAGEFTVGELQVFVLESASELAALAASHAAQAIRSAVHERAVAYVMFASGNSQLAFLDALGSRGDVEWDRVVGFHMDEYTGMSAEHPAGLARYMRERIVDQMHPADFHFIDGRAADPEREAARYAALLHDHRLDVCCLGIGENGHLAFNDPAVADFDDPLDVKVVELDDACRGQQVGEGHFAAVADVPTRAITVTIPALLRARRVLAIVPEARKADAVRRALEEPIRPGCPASVLRRAAHAALFLDHESSNALLRNP
jgi:glucosamine-6-phosphate deaminase